MSHVGARDADWSRTMADDLERMRAEDDVEDPDAGKKTTFGITALIAITAIAIIVGAVIVIAVL
jgi:hypothetical protein